MLICYNFLLLLLDYISFILSLLLDEIMVFITYLKIKIGGENMKKIITFLLSSVLLFGSIVPISATSEKTESTFEEALKCMVVQKTNEGIELSFPGCNISKKRLTQGEIDKLHEIALLRSVSSSGDTILPFSIQPFGRPTHKVEFGPSVRKKFSGFAGNQPPQGTRLKRPGGFFYSDNGGPVVSISVSLPFPSLPNSSVGVSVSLGQKSSSGQYISVPNTKNFFKLHVEKTYDCRRYIVWAIDSKGKKTAYSGGVSKVHIDTTLDVIKVK